MRGWVPVRLKKNASNRKTSAGLARGLYRIARRPADQRRVLPNRRGFADEIALHRVAAHLREEAELLLGFHALGDNRHSKAVAKTDHCANDRRRLRIAPEIDDESAVDLDLVERKRLQIAQRRIAAAEIVHGNAHAQRLQPP